jgi:aspartyl-tRNA synthetase
VLDHLGDWKKSHACGALRATDEGVEVTLMGWVHRRREHGGLAFVDLRDSSGICQVVFQEAMSDRVGELGSEWVVALRGKMRMRPEGMRNADMPSGDVELLVDEMRVLNASQTPPFPIESSHQGDVSEDLRLKYRYLDLRRREMQDRMTFRHDLVLQVRDFLSSEGFREIETPLLIRSTPEGARDYVVPSRIHHGMFYALPQSPQLYKQLLMVAGYEKYFQMARCLRDEDLRGDRQPEHTQIDMEMSFVTEDEVFDVVERLLESIFSKVMGKELELPFARMSFQEVMDRYGSDKPDLRFDLELVDLSEPCAASNFKAFTGVIENGGVVKGLRVPGGASFSRKEIEELEKSAKTYRAKGLAWMKVASEGLASGVSKFFTGEPGATIVKLLGAEAGDLVLMVGDVWETAAQAMGAVRNALGRKLDLIQPGIYRFLWVNEFPLFERDDEKEEWVAMHHLFTMPLDEDMKYLDSDPGKLRGQLYDLVCNGVELASGSIRIHRRDIQEKIMAVVGIDKAEAEKRFGFLLGAFDFGAPPHGGIAPGLDRLLMVLDGGDSIRDYIAFPKTLQAKSLMVDCPAPIDGDQLTELGIDIREEEG